MELRGRASKIGAYLSVVGMGAYLSVVGMAKAMFKNEE